MKPIETLTKEYYCEEQGEVWVPNLSKFTKLDLYGSPNSESYIDSTGTLVFKSYGPLADPIPYIIFEILKDIENPHLVGLKRRFYGRFNDIDINTLQTTPAVVPIDGYTRTHIREEKIELLKRKKEYLLENISELQKLFDLFSQRRVCANFKRRDDLRVDVNGIVILNPDNFTMSDDENLFFHNRKSLLAVVGALAFKEYSEQLFHPNTDGAIRAITDLLDSSMAKEPDLAVAIEKKLSGSSRPIQYVKKYM